eukprot:scpid70745/ scgid18591/ 
MASRPGKVVVRQKFVPNRKSWYGVHTMPVLKESENEAKEELLMQERNKHKKPVSNAFTVAQVRAWTEQTVKLQQLRARVSTTVASAPTRATARPARQRSAPIRDDSEAADASAFSLDFLDDAAF